jgi:DNA-directed RNA polymerase specialized sigma24 family protein
MLSTCTTELIYGSLRARAYELTGSASAADDLTQETLLRLLERPPGREGTTGETLHYARLTMRSVFLREFVGAARRAVSAGA